MYVQKIVSTGNPSFKYNYFLYQGNKRFKGIYHTYLGVILLFYVADTYILALVILDPSTAV